jgi:hypothetical protein
MLLTIGETMDQQELPIEPPARFGCRADISDKRLMFAGEFGAVCGGQMAVFCDGEIEGENQVLDSMGGFQYGAVFMSNISHRILTYSEDGLVSLWSLGR